MKKTKNDNPRTHFEQIPVSVAKSIATVTPRNVVIEKPGAKTEPYTRQGTSRLDR